MIRIVRQITTSVHIVHRAPEERIALNDQRDQLHTARHRFFNGGERQCVQRWSIGRHFGCKFDRSGLVFGNDGFHRLPDFIPHGDQGFDFTRPGQRRGGPPQSNPVFLIRFSQAGASRIQYPPHHIQLNPDCGIQRNLVEKLDE